MSKLPDRTGRFRGYPTEWALGESKGGNPCFSCLWRLTEWWSPDEQKWYDYTGQDAEITSFTYLLSRDLQSPSENAIAQLRNALGWSGQNIPELQDRDWSKCGATLVIEHDSYQDQNGNTKTKLKVQWLDGWDATGSNRFSIQKAPAEKLSALQNRFGGMFRAMSPQPLPAAPPPAGKPKAPPPPPPPVAAKVHPSVTETPAEMDEDSIPF